ncbi:hypothetical protein HK099_001335 [Clydaea vesicula]|uniref:Uncharacterized protein n=1 Tax=Clydaea vesicula TaxID=447962 RepID=A0AAD5TWV7_9FUNG|nr:hypothetical protein HK099_001335 [Clydaea vesicula]
MFKKPLYLLYLLQVAAAQNEHQRDVRQSQSTLIQSSKSISSTLQSQFSFPDISSALSHLDSVFNPTSTTSSFSTSIIPISSSTLVITTTNLFHIPTISKPETATLSPTFSVSSSINANNKPYQFNLVLILIIGGIVLGLAILIALILFLRKKYNVQQKELYCTESDGSISRTQSIRVHSSNPTKAFSVYEENSNKDGSSKSGGSLRRHTVKSSNSEGILDEWTKSIEEDEKKLIDK